MARTRSERIAAVKADMTARLRGGRYRPGERFLSARELASDFGISYQTADRLLNELTRDGLLERRAASGTFVPGRVRHRESGLTEVRFLFASRARRPNSFGARLQTALAERLRRDGIHWQTSWAEVTSVDEVPSDCFLVLWEAPAALAACRRGGRRALLLNASPLHGLDAAGIDSVTLDDFAGGVLAAELLLQRGSRGPGRDRLAIMSGPPGDARSDARRDGFLSRVPAASVVNADGWYVEDGRRVAAEASRQGRDGLFCANDRLAEAILDYCRTAGVERPPLVGFDDAPVAAANDLTTIAIPWSELVSDAADIILARLSGDGSAARRRTVVPRPIVRSF
jgi:hypothetical protein